MNDNIFTEKAHEIAKRFNIDKFTRSGGWIDYILLYYVGSKKGMILCIDKFLMNPSPLMAFISLNGVKIF